jgi:hypothetical protein
LIEGITDRVCGRIDKIEFDEEEPGGDAIDAQLGPQARFVDQLLQLGAVRDVDHLALGIGQSVAGEFARHLDLGMLMDRIVADADAHDPPEAIAAQFHGRAQIQALDRLVEKDLEALRLRKHAHAAEGDHPHDSERDRAEHEQTDEGRAEFGFHGEGSEAGGRDLTSKTARGLKPAGEEGRRLRPG